MAMLCECILEVSVAGVPEVIKTLDGLGFFVCATNGNGACAIHPVFGELLKPPAGFSILEVLGSIADVLVDRLCDTDVLRDLELVL